MLEKPPVFNLEPPPLLPFPIELSLMHTNKSKFLLNSNDLNELLKCSRENKRNGNYKQESTFSALNKFLVSFKNELFKANPSNDDTTSPHNTYLTISLIVITFLIVLLIVFILFAVFYLRRFKKNKYEHSSINKNSSTSNSLINNVFNTSSPATVSSLTFNSSLTPPLSQSSKSSVTSEFNELADAILNDHQTINYKNTTTSRMIPNHFNSTSFFPISTRNVHNESANTTNSTIDTFNSRHVLIPNTALKPHFAPVANRFQSNQHEQQDQHYYESIGDPSQFYFDVDQQTTSFRNPLLNVNNKRSPIILTPSTVSMTLNEESYPSSCSNCTLLKLNNHKPLAQQAQHMFQNDTPFQQSNTLRNHPTQTNMTNQFFKSLIV